MSNLRRSPCNVAAAAVNHLPLAVHHVVIQQALRTPKLFSSTFLWARSMDFAIIECWITSFLVAHPVHHLGDALTLEEAHQVVFEGDVELAAARVSWRPERPRNWRSTRRLSWRSVR